jgi:hypothetical protein
MDNLANKENNKRLYFTRDHIKLISPSTQMLGLENKDIQFFVKHYGNSEVYFLCFIYIKLEIHGIQDEVVRG